MSKPTICLYLDKDGFQKADLIGQGEDDLLEAKELYLSVEGLLNRWEKDLKKTNKTKAVKEKQE